MPDIIIKPEDIENMPEETRSLFIEYIRNKFGLQSKESDQLIKDQGVMLSEPTLYEDDPKIIPIEAAIAILAPLKSNGRKVIELLCEKGTYVDHFPFKLIDWEHEKNEGVSRADLAEALGSGLLRICMKKDEDIPWAQRASDEAAERGVRLAHQCHAASLFETIEGSLGVLRRVDRPNFGLI